MTFYWWSHWFWITLTCNLIFPFIVVVHTYPSQELALENNHNQQKNTKKLVTKLYQASAWTTDASNYLAGENVRRLMPQNITKRNEMKMTEISANAEPVTSKNNEIKEDYYDKNTSKSSNKEINIDHVEAELERNNDDISFLNKKGHEIDIKRSAEVIHTTLQYTTSDPKSELQLLTTSTAAPVVEKNNYTNFTDKLVSTSTNKNTNASKILISATNTTTNNNDNDSTFANTLINATTQMSNASLTPKITKAQAGSLNWLNTVAAQIQPAHLTTGVTQDDIEDQHKIPFTLENVNHPEDLRKEGNEPRSRKSKGLSAEYKVNHYINYSSDSKNLLTRSPATTVNEYDNEESNISPKALSVQRPYYMEVGAISAICFTVLGICCTVGTISIVLYRRRFLNKPQTLSEPDSSVYIDDSTMRVSDNSDEMYSLDNDSFLNSLEAMTIQNYWTDTVKHTKL